MGRRFLRQSRMLRWLRRLEPEATSEAAPSYVGRPLDSSVSFPSFPLPPRAEENLVSRCSAVSFYNLCDIVSLARFCRSRCESARILHMAEKGVRV